MEGQKYNVPAYAIVFGILALVFAIVGVIIPVVGPLFITPLAIIFCCIALYGGYKTMGIATLIIVVINLIISPSIWANLVAATHEAGPNRFLVYFDLIGVVAMFYLAIRKRKIKVRQDVGGDKKSQS